MMDPTIQGFLCKGREFLVNCYAIFFKNKYYGNYAHAVLMSCKHYEEQDAYSRCVRLSESCSRCLFWLSSKPKITLANLAKWTNFG